MPESEFAGGPVVDRVVALVLPILRDLAIDLYDCEFTGGIVRVTVSKPGGLDLDAIALVTRLLGRELEHDDPIPGRYTLEVSSPGLERQLRRPDHFTGAIGSTVAVRLHAPVDGARRYQGTLVASDADGIVVRLDDAALTEQRLAYDQIDRARTVFVWGPTPKPGKPVPAKAAKPTTPGRSSKRPAASAASSESDTSTQEAGAS